MTNTVVMGSNVIEFDSYNITRNFWGAPADEKLSGEIFLNQDYSYGWSWDRPDPQMKPGVKGVLPIYPNVRIGADSGQPTNNKLFPIQARDIQQLLLSVDYNYLELPTGEYNLAFQLYFLNNADLQKVQSPQAEVMVWLQHSFGQPPYTYKGDFTEGNNIYELYAWTMADGRLYSSFIRKPQVGFTAQYQVDAKKLLDNLDIDPAWYLLGVHLGNEVLIGSGKIQINTLTVYLNGQQISFNP